MKKALLYGPFDLRVEDVLMPEPGPGQVRVRVLVSAPYGTDLKWFTGQTPAVYPCGFGGESAGVIDKLGPGVNDRFEGQRVTPLYFPHCGKCHFCLAGRDNLCDRFQDLTEEKTHLACFTEFLLSSVERALPLPDNVSLDNAAMLASVCCAVNIKSKLNYRAGESVLVIGGGPFGPANIQMAKVAGCKVAVLEHRDRRRELMKAFGADLVLDPRECDVKAALREFFGEGPDHVIETSGSKTSTRQCLEFAGRGGKVATMGAGHHDFSAYEVLQKELSVYGVRGMTEAQRKESLAIMARGEVDLVPYVTHRLPFVAIADAFRMMAEGAPDVGRVLLDH